MCRAGRALLGWNAEKLAEEAKIGVATVRRFELGSPIRDGSRQAIRQAMEAAGVEFIESGVRPPRGGQGARLRQ